RGKLLALQELEEGAARRGHVADAVGHAELRQRRNGFTAARERERGGVDDRLGERLRATSELIVFEYAQRAVPDAGTGALDRRAERGCRLRADVEDEVVISNLG